MIDFSKPIPFITTWQGILKTHVRVNTTYESTPKRIMREWYEDLCSADELQRILNVQNAQDYILRAAVDTIAKKPVLCRVILEHKRISGTRWSLEKFFMPITYGYYNFKRHIPIELQHELDNIGTGCLLSNHMNGIIFTSHYGLCSVLSYSLKYVIEYATLALLPLEGDISDVIRTTAMILAIRISKGIERLDLDINKRCHLPKRHRKSMREPLPYICTFIAGHEYSHYLNKDIKPHTRKRLMPEDAQTLDIDSFFTFGKIKEFNADVTALRLPEFSKNEYSDYYLYSLLWFAILAIFETASHREDESIHISSHPSAMQRYYNILKKAPKPYDFDEMENIYTTALPQAIDFWRDAIAKDVAIHPEIYNSYGSFYVEQD